MFRLVIDSILGGTAFFNPDGNENLMAYWYCQDHLEGREIPEKKQFIFRLPGEKKFRTMHRYNGRWFCDLADLFDTTKDYKSVAFATSLELASDELSGAPTTYKIETIDDNKRKFSKRDLGKVEIVKNFIENMALPSISTLIKMCKHGSMINVPFTTDDIRNYTKIYKAHLWSVRGKTTNSTMSAPPIQVSDLVDTETSIYSDILYIDQIKFFLTVTDNDTVLLTHLASYLQSDLEKCVAAQISFLRARSMNIKFSSLDAESSLKAIVPFLQDVCRITVDTKPRGTKVDIAERKIRVVKERFRGILSGLPFHLPKFWIKHLVSFIVTRLNSFASNLFSHGTPPKEQLIGRKLNYITDVNGKFGDYAQAYVATDNTPNSRTIGSILMYPLYDRTGGWIIMNLNTNNTCKCDKFNHLPMPSDVISRINEKAKSDGGKDYRRPENANVWRLGNRTIGDEIIE